MRVDRRVRGRLCPSRLHLDERATKCDIDRTVARQLALERNDGTNEERLVYLASRLVNNSMVGGSKFLHFHAPERFPFTDSWLQRLSGKRR